MPGHIAEGKLQRRQVFRQVSPPIQSSVIPASRDGVFIPWRTPTRDAAPSKPSTIGEAHKQQHLSLEKVVAACADVAARISALEQKRSAQAQLAEQMLQQQRLQQQPPTEQPNHILAQDHAAPCSCQHQPAPQAPYRDGVTHMDRNPALAPNRNLTFGAFPNPRMATRDQQQLQYGEKPPSRFSSEFVEKAASYLPPGSASRVTTKEAVNDINLRAPRDSAGHNVSGPPQPAMTQGSDLSSAFASELQKIPPGQPARAQNVLNQHYNAAKTSDARDAIERTWKDFSSHYDAKGDNPWRPKQAEARDANWSSLYEQNKSTIGGDPNKIQIGQSLNLPGGGTHVVEKGETLSGIASSTGSDLGSRSLAAERGGTESTGGNYGASGPVS
ncbi:MAG TPA: LysM peptidoglycan-binding domain-containing protein, partial [Methylocystis sp.]